MKKYKDAWIYLLILVIVADMSIVFVSIMGFLNYRTSALTLEEQVIGRIEQESVSSLETAIGFGKSFTNYYGMEDVFASFNHQISGTTPFVLNSDGEIMYCDNADESREDVEKFLKISEVERKFNEIVENDGGIIKKDKKNLILTAIHQDGSTIGYFGTLYSERLFDSSFSNVKRSIALVALIIALLENIGLMILVRILRSDRWTKRHRRSSDALFEKMTVILIMSASILTLSGLSISQFQKDYMQKMEDSVLVSMQNLEDTIRRVKVQGVDLRTVDGLSKYIEDRISSLTTVRTVRVSEHISEVKRTDEESQLLYRVIDINEDEGVRLYLEAELSTEAVQKEMQSIMLVLLSTMIILMIFVFELNNLVDLFAAKVKSLSEGKQDVFSEKQVGTALRFTGFLCSTAEYMCVPYAAMLIRESGEALFGLSVGMTAALPLTLEGLMQMIAMLVLPRFVKKFNIRGMLVFSAALMVLCNLTAFSIGGALVIVICRALAGMAYAGFKQVSNFLITNGYETEAGRSANISQDNAGLLAGATCGAGLGAILSANSGYSMTFVYSAFLFAAYLLTTLYLLPWKTLVKKKSDEGEEKPVKPADIAKMIFSGEMLFYILVIGIPLNIGVMLCVTLIPAICQTNGISSVMLSYCYIANGIAGIYVGPAMVSTAKKYFGIPASISFAFALTALSIFILRIPPLVLMIVLTSMFLGFLDGFGTPMCTDQFMELNVVKHAVDESTALVFSVVLSYVLLTFAPMIAELMLIPDKGLFSPMLIGACVYAAAAVLVFFYRKKTKQA